eukprot:CAMPEP_0205900750 /NCGR_PEP_ID=MMETSP1083-20121108/27308_1 /ASSEMBLY_ACC=CAM_ASM_000430 /TAXON_ID=97485 /ORGANISM="Prymnesium parvum, Strain Texoma1" /LENGTH=233 /DNA_ID=CAMNT_0053266219 /DNA_START=342 /DNA_END=1039 /DNA_ORIENTATION=+
MDLRDGAPVDGCLPPAIECESPQLVSPMAYGAPAHGRKSPSCGCPHQLKASTHCSGERSAVLLTRHEGSTGSPARPQPPATALPLVLHRAREHQLALPPRPCVAAPPPDDLRGVRALNVKRTFETPPDDRMQLDGLPERFHVAELQLHVRRMKPCAASARLRAWQHQRRGEQAHGPWQRHDCAGAALAHVPASRSCASPRASPPEGPSAESDSMERWADRMPAAARAASSLRS